MNEGVPLSPAKLDTIAGRQLFDIRCLIRVGFSRDQDAPMRYRRNIFVQIAHAGCCRHTTV